MKYSILSSLAAILAQASALALPVEPKDAPASLIRRQNTSCEHGPNSRGCWSDGFSIDTDYYTSWPETGNVKEYWLVVTNTTLAPDGVSRQVLAFNNTIPGPAITADWGDDIIVHVKNDLVNNGTAIHWHGIRQLATSEYDGVPGVTQCPTKPGDSMTYRFKASQYGTSWYHSHFSIQYGDGLVGPLIIKGPSSDEYDEDLGLFMLQDWGHSTAFQGWYNSARKGGPPRLENGLINGKNTYHVTGSGERLVTKFEKGKKYLIRLVNSGLDGYIKFTIDNHKFKVIANDLVPIVPYDATNVVLGNGQRYDIVVEATEGDDIKNFWMRAVWMTACAPNDAGDADEIKAIVRYEGADEADPTTSQVAGITQACADEDYTKLVPYLNQTVGSAQQQDDLAVSFTTNVTDGVSLFWWTINTSTLMLEWEDPTTLMVMDEKSIFPTDYNSFPVTNKDQWIYLIIQNPSAPFALNHPIHLHGHDMFVIGQSSTPFDRANPGFNLSNPPRRDTATLPAGGYLAIAFYSDNPGAWIAHCHIAWHASGGLSFQVVERESEIAATIDDPQQFRDTCAAWNDFEKTQLWPQDDSGI